MNQSIMQQSNGILFDGNWSEFHISEQIFVYMHANIRANQTSIDGYIHIVCILDRMRY